MPRLTANTPGLAAAGLAAAGLVVASVLAVDPWGWDQVGPLRWALVSTLGWLTVAAGLAGAGNSEPPAALSLKRWSPGLVVVGGWVLVLGGMVVSTLRSDEPRIALFGTPDRHLGLTTWGLFAGIGLAVALASTAGGRDAMVRPVAWAAVVAAGASGVFAFVESVSDLGLADGFGGRTGAAFGQPAYLGAAMVLCVPLACWLAVSTPETRSGWGRSLAGLGAVLGGFALVTSGTRGAWLGALVAIGCVVAANGRAGMARFRHHLGVGGVVVGLVLAGAAVMLALAGPGGDRVAEVFDGDDGPVAGRVDEWQVGVRALGGVDGVVGRGPESYRTVFGAFVDADYVVTHGRSVITDRAHNVYLDTALAGGWAAGLGLVVVHAGLAWAAWRRLRHPSGLVDVALAAAVVAYLVQGWFLFPLAEVDPVLWVIAALLLTEPTRVRSNAQYGENQRTSATTGGVLGGAAVLVALVAAVAAVGGVGDVRADHAIASSFDPGVDPAEAVTVALDAVDYQPNSIRYRFIAARRFRQTGDVADLDRALDQLAAGLDLAPTDPALLSEQGDLLLVKARITGTDADLGRAITALEHLDSVDPNHPENQQNLGIALALAERWEEAAVRLERATWLAPSSPEPWLNLALVHLRTGDLEAMEAAVAEAEAIDPTDPRIEALRSEADRQ